MLPPNGLLYHWHHNEICPLSLVEQTNRRRHPDAGHTRVVRVKQHVAEDVTHRTRNTKMHSFVQTPVYKVISAGPTDSKQCRFVGRLRGYRDFEEAEHTKRRRILDLDGMNVFRRDGSTSAPRLNRVLLPVEIEKE